MAENRHQNSRVYGSRVGRGFVKDPVYTRAGKTPEELARKEAETKAAYEVWRREREARKAARYLANRSRNMGL